MFNPISKIDAKQVGLDADLLEAAKKCCMENDPYNPSAAGPANLPSEPSSSGQKMSITDEKKKIKKEGATTDSMKPGYIKTDRGYA